MRRMFYALALLISELANAAPIFEPGSCVQEKAETCIDTTPCKKLGDVTACLANATNKPDNAVTLVDTCWQYEAAFTCRDTTSVDSCQPLREKGCGMVNTQCLTRKDDGTCISSTQTMQCPDKPPTTKETMVCSTSICADGGGCFDTSRPTDKDFGQAAAMMEAAREAGVYGLNGENVEVFKGYMEECSVKTIGGSTVKSCCAAAGGGAKFNNYTVIGRTAAEGAYVVGKEELKAGSKYVYDALFQTQDAGLIQEGMSAAAGGLSEQGAEAAAGAAGNNFGAYGFTFSYTAEAGFSFVGFDPWSFAFAVAVAIITEWLSCEPEELTMQMKRGQNLCVYVESYCSSKAVGVCTEKKEKHCCFNSILAKLINRQGRAQLALPMNTCGGFNQAQLAQIDFGAIDFSEFIATIVPTNPNGAALTERAQNIVNQKVENYYGSEVKP